MRAVLPASLLALVAVGCAAGGTDSSPPRAGASADPCAVALAAGTRTVAFGSGGQRRTARLDVPATPAGRRVGLIVALHFAGGTGPAMAAYTRLSAPAGKAGFAVAYPAAVKADHVWRLRSDAAGDADVRQIADLLDAVAGVACIDAGRTFATGVSNGGGMAAKLACALPARFAAVAPVAPGLKAIAPCPAGRAVGILEIHGLADTVVPYGGSGAGHAGAVRPWLGRWARRNRCGDLIATPIDRRVRPRILRERWSGCAAPVEHVRLRDTDHGWPGARGRLPRHDPTGVNATREVLRFFTRVVQASPFRAASATIPAGD